MTHTAYHHTIALNDSASAPRTDTFDGTREEAIAYFHGRIGPQWPVVFDDVEGVFTMLPDDALRFVPTVDTRSMIEALIDRLKTERLNHPGGRGVMAVDLVPPEARAAIVALEALL